LAGANLSEANLSGTHLGAPLPIGSLSVLFGKVSSGLVKLTADYLSGTQLTAADLSGANLSGAKLSAPASMMLGLIEVPLGLAQLRETDLSGANLSTVDLRGVDLSGANLSGCNVTKEQLAQCESLKGATLPDGTKDD